MVLDERRLAKDLPVEWTCDDDPEEEEGRLLRGHPGRITDPSPEDIFVRWFGLEHKQVSYGVCYGPTCLDEITEAEYARRVERIRSGLPPMD